MAAGFKYGLPTLDLPDPPSYDSISPAKASGCGVPCGVPEGVVLALLTLVFLAPERGVMLGLRGVGVGAPFSFGGEAIPVSGRVARLSRGVEAFDGVAPAILGVRGIVCPDLMLGWLNIGASVLGVVGLS